MLKEVPALGMCLFQLLLQRLWAQTCTQVGQPGRHLSGWTASLAQGQGEGLAERGPLTATLHFLLHPRRAAEGLMFLAACKWIPKRR